MTGNQAYLAERLIAGMKYSKEKPLARSGVFPESRVVGAFPLHVQRESHLVQKASPPEQAHRASFVWVEALRTETASCL